MVPDRRPLIVASWQESGVAWAPWRYASALGAAAKLNPSTTAIIMLCAANHEMENYGLPQSAFFKYGSFDEFLARVSPPDVLHLHHAFAAVSLIPRARIAWPKTKIVVTIHGEPDRSLGVGGVDPDAFHVVEPRLLELVASHRAVFIPNHPATPPGFVERTGQVFWLPYSHVARFKDHDVAVPLGAELKRRGWTFVQDSRPRPNKQVREILAASTVVWIHRQGYYDILSMEAWESGCLAMVEEPREMIDSMLWKKALGFAPEVAPTGALIDDGCALDWLLTNASSATVEHNLAGMRHEWTLARAGIAWNSFYWSVVEGN